MPYATAAFRLPRPLAFLFAHAGGVDRPLAAYKLGGTRR
jgi:hypothetical protein